MADGRETAQNKENGRPLAQAPHKRERGRGGRKGHMAAGGETVSDHITSNLPKKAQKKLFRFERPAWWNRRGAR